MNARRYVVGLVALSMAMSLSARQVPVSQLPSEAVQVQGRFGTIAGLVTKEGNVPVPSATVTATRVDGNGIRTTISGSDGIYSFADMSPGVYSVTSQAEGDPDVIVASLQVTAGK